jgi:histone H3/H4/RNA polymerase subunit RPABC4/transcription elongation factor Spt4
MFADATRTDPTDDEYYCNKCGRILNDDIDKCKHCGTRKRKRQADATHRWDSPAIVSLSSASYDPADEKLAADEASENDEEYEPIRKRDTNYYLQKEHADTYNSDVEDFVHEGCDWTSADAGIDQYESLLSSREMKVALPTLVELLPKVLAREVALYGNIDSTAEDTWQAFIIDKRREQAKEDCDNDSDNPENEERDEGGNSDDENEELEDELNENIRFIREDRGEEPVTDPEIVALKEYAAVVACRVRILIRRTEDLEDKEEERYDAEGKARGELRAEVDSFCELAVCAELAERAKRAERAECAGLNPNEDDSDGSSDGGDSDGSSDGGDSDGSSDGGDSDGGSDDNKGEENDDEVLRREFQRLKIQMRARIRHKGPESRISSCVLDAIPSMSLAPRTECGGRSPLLYWGERLVRAADALLGDVCDNDARVLNPPPDRDTCDNDARVLDLALATQITNMLHDINLRLLELRPEWKEDERHARALAEIGSEQARTDFCLPRDLFQMLVREIGQDFNNDLEYEEEAMDALQTAAEAHLIRLFQASQSLAVHADRQEVQPKDMQLACQLLEEKGEP